MAYYALHEFGIMPHVLMALPVRERAAIYACIEVRVKKEKPLHDKLRK